ncbi:hypothetical protein KC963_04435, partial [Candidatus Saccharibacteria bacterium]|nr:hypothetical protein [Candidatus Saccharibacteria bacterium]
PYHWQALAALVNGVDVNVRLEAIARKVHLTASRLIDDINQFALESVRDIVVDAMDETPQIEDEDVQGLIQLLEWAMAQGILEI